MVENRLYYLKEEELALGEIIRSLQKDSAYVQAGLIRKKHEAIKQQCETDGKAIASHTQVAVKSIYGQIDTAIKGKAGQALKTAINTTLPQYGNIFLE